MCTSYFLIDSIKGGCGKTTFAIMLTQYLEKQYGKIGHTVLLDFDFLGTGLINLFLTEDKIHEFEKENRYITDIIRGFQTEEARYIFNCSEGETPFYVAFGNPKYMTKHAYRLSSKLNYTPAINYGIFRKGIQNIIQDKKSGDSEDNIEEHLSLVKNIVIDMSPGMDTYSEAVKECLFDKRHSLKLRKNSRCVYVLMLGMDLSHVAAAKNYFELLKESDDKIPDKIAIMINDPMRMADLLSKDKQIETYDLVVDLFCRNLSISQEYAERTAFFVLNFYEEYAKKVHDNKSLYPLKESSIFLDNPFKCWCRWGEKHMREIDTFSEENLRNREWEEWLTKEKADE